MDQSAPDASNIEFIRNTHEIWEAVHRDCAAATASIDLEQYILRDDETGRRFFQIFTEKAKQGVQVRLLLDRVGCRTLFESELVKTLKEAGGSIHFYNSIGWINLFFPATWFPRNHTKVVKIDSRIAHIGGACFADYMRGWRDLEARITGDLPGGISFAWDQRKRKQHDASEGDFRYVVIAPRFMQNPVYKELITEIEKAKERIWLATPYFLPPLRLRRALRKAIRRGVDVRVIMSEETDVPLAMHTAQSYFPNLMRDGFRIFLYQGTVFHAKYMIVDGWATLGSINIDYLSLLYNRESNIIIRHRETVEVLGKHFQDDLRNCREAGIDFWSRLPWTSKLVGVTGRLVKKML